MTRFAPLGVAIAVLAAPVGSAAEESRRTTVPQPRARLLPEVTGATAVPATTEPVATTATSTAATTDSAVLLPKMVVRDTKLPAPPRARGEEERLDFSPLKGGPMFKSKVGTSVFEIGLWPNSEAIPEDAVYQPQRTHAELQVFRLRW